MDWIARLQNFLGAAWRKTLAALRSVAALYHVENLKQRGLFWSSILLLVTVVIFLFVVGIFWSQEPDSRDVRQIALEMAQGDNERVVPGFTTTATEIFIVTTLLDKPGGYLSNDKFPPSSFFGFFQLLDNIPNWEFGALVMARDTARVLRNDFSRSQSQSLENPDLAEAEPLLNFNNDSWLFPATESEYRKAVVHLNRYLDQLSQKSETNTQFFTRADNLNELLSVVEKRLGNFSQRLNASVEELRVNTDLAGDPDAQQSTATPGLVVAKTPWLDIDNVFYEARGYVWALTHVLRAIQIDFDNVLKKKNASASLQQVIRLLEQAAVEPSSPIVLNGAPLGWMANYSKSMVSYISPANAAIIDLRNLLTKG